MTVVNRATYAGGLSVESADLGAAGAFTWLGLAAPSADELELIAQEFDVPAGAMAALQAEHLRSSVERHGETLALVVRSARYIDSSESVDFGLLHLLVSPAALVTVRRSEFPHLTEVRRGIEQQPEFLALGPRAALWAILAEVVSQYQPVVDGLENDIDEIEDQIFSEHTQPGVSQRIYQLHREVIGFERAARPLADVVAELGAIQAAQTPGGELERRFLDLHARLARIVDHIATFRVLLDNALSAHAAIVSHRQTDASLAQTEQTKKISAWAAILYIPSLVGAIYGMNFDHMPELHWAWGYPFSIALMVALSGVLYAVFKKATWL